MFDIIRLWEINFQFVFLAMANVMVITKTVDETAGSDSKSLDNVEAGVSDLLKGKPVYEKTLRFGPYLVDQGLIKYYEGKDFFPVGTARAPDVNEVIRAPREGEAVVFRELFNAGLRFPCNDRIPLILDSYNVKLHQLTPNAIIQLFKVFWVAKTFGSDIDVDAFIRHHELHHQRRIVIFDGSPEKFDAQLGCCSFVARRENKRKNIRRVELSFAQNKWENNWPLYWFYVKVGRPDPLNPETTIYPFAWDVEELKVTHVPDYDSKPETFKSCCRAFYLATMTLSCRDVFEEALTANIWPLSRGWAPNRMEKRTFPAAKKSYRTLVLTWFAQRIAMTRFLWLS